MCVGGCYSGRVCVLVCVKVARINSPSFNLIQVGPKEAAGKGAWVRAVEGKESTKK